MTKHGGTDKNDALTVIITHIKRAIYSIPTPYKNITKTVNHERYKATITGKLKELEKVVNIIEHIEHRRLKNSSQKFITMIYSYNQLFPYSIPPGALLECSTEMI